MKKIQAIIKPFKLDDAKQALAEIDVIAEKIKKSDETIEGARARAWDENPKLFEQYQSERRRALRAAGEE